MSKNIENLLGFVSVIVFGLAIDLAMKAVAHNNHTGAYWAVIIAWIAGGLNPWLSSIYRQKKNKK